MKASVDPKAFMWVSHIRKREITGISQLSRDPVLFFRKRIPTTLQPLSTFFPSIGNPNHVVLLGFVPGRLISIDMIRNDVCIFLLNENDTECINNFVKVDGTFPLYRLDHSGEPLSECCVECVLCDTMFATLVLNSARGRESGILLRNDCTFAEFRIWIRNNLILHRTLSSLQKKSNIFTSLTGFKFEDEALLCTFTDGGSLNIYAFIRHGDALKRQSKPTSCQNGDASFFLTLDDGKGWLSLKERKLTRQDLCDEHDVFALLDIQIDFDVVARLFLKEFYPSLTPRSIIESEIRVVGLTSESNILILMSLCLTFKGRDGRINTKKVASIFSYDIFASNICSVMFCDLDLFVTKSNANEYNHFMNSYITPPTTLLAATDFYASRLQRNNSILKLTRHCNLKTLSSHLMSEIGTSLTKIQLEHIDVIVFNDERDD